MNTARLSNTLLLAVAGLGLLARAPASANRYADGEIVQVPLADVRPGDRLLARAVEIVPVDGVVTSGTAVLDEAALTGEALPVRRPSGDRARSGTVNAGSVSDRTIRVSGSDQLGVELFVLCFQGIRDLEVHCHSAP
jgi:cation transport ATPase